MVHGVLIVDFSLVIYYAGLVGNMVRNELITYFSFFQVQPTFSVAENIGDLMTEMWLLKMGTPDLLKNFGCCATDMNSYPC